MCETVLQTDSDQEVYLTIYPFEVNHLPLPAATGTGSLY